MSINIGYYEMDEYGNAFTKYSRFKDWDGNPVERDKYKHPYTYDAYVVYQKKKKYMAVLYSDKLQQCNYNKYTQSHKEVFGDKSQGWSNESHSKIEKFLQLYNDDPSIKLVGIMEGCNVGNGYPYWIFMYDYDKKEGE